MTCSMPESISHLVTQKSVTIRIDHSHMHEGQSEKLAQTSYCLHVQLLLAQTQDSLLN